MFRFILDDEELSDKKKAKALKRACKSMKKPLPLLCKLLQKQAVEPKSPELFIKACRSIMIKTGNEKSIAKKFAILLEKLLSMDRFNVHVIYCVYELERILIEEFKKSEYDIKECKTLVDKDTFHYLAVLLNQKKDQRMPDVLYEKVKSTFYIMI